jgi:transposase
MPSDPDALLERALAAERRVAELTEALREAERRADQRSREAAAQIRQLTALVKGMQKQLAELLRDRPTSDKVAMPASSDDSVVEAAPGKPEEPPPKHVSGTPRSAPPPRPPERRQPKAPPQKPVRRADPAPKAPHDTRITPVDRCGKCGSDDLAKVGAQSATRLVYVRAHVRVVEEVRETCRCRRCEAFTTPPMPPTAVPGGMMSASMLAHIAYGKGFLHLPLSRIADDLRLLGVDLAKGTMSDAMRHVSTLVRPVADAITDSLFASGVLWYDGSGIKVLEPGEKGKHLGQIAVCSNAEAAVYHYSPTKHGTHGAEFFRVGKKNAYRGLLHADAASTSNLLYVDGNIRECGCWYHARAMFVEARPGAREDADAAIAWIAALFQVEHEADDAGDTPERRLERRHRDSKPILDGFVKWMAEAQQRYSTEEELPKAIRYVVRNQWVPLNRFLEDGRVHLTNNRAERDLGPLGRGRKAWLHAGSDEGAARIADVYTIVETCRRQELDPFAYMVDVLPLLSTMPANRGRSATDLTPKAWKARRKGPGP